MYTKEEREGILWEFRQSGLSDVAILNWTVG